MGRGAARLLVGILWMTSGQGFVPGHKSVSSGVNQALQSPSGTPSTCENVQYTGPPRSRGQISRRVGDSPVPDAMFLDHTIASIGRPGFKMHQPGFSREVPLPLPEEWKIFNHASVAGNNYTLEELLTYIDEATPWLKGIGCATAIHRVSVVLGHKKPSIRRLGVNDRRFRKLIERTQVLLPTLTPRSFSMILYAFGKLDFFPGQAWMDECRDAIMPKLEKSFDARCLANLIMGMLKIGYKPGREFMVVFAEAVMDQMMDFQSVGLMTVIHAFAKMDFHPGEAFLRIFAACTKRRLKDFSPRELSSTIQGLATLRYLPSEDFMALYLECVEKKLHRFSWLDLPNCMTALSKLLYVPDEAFMDKFVKRAEEELHVFNSQALSNFIFGLFKLKYDPGPGFMETFFRASLSKLDRFTAAGFASMLHSAARMGYYPGEAFISELEVYATPKLPQFSRAEIWKIIHGFASISYRPSRVFMESFWRSVARDSAMLTLKDASVMVWSLSALELGADQHLDSLAELVDLTAALMERSRANEASGDYPPRRTGDAPPSFKHRQLLQALAYLETLEGPRIEAATARLRRLVTEAWASRSGAGDHFRGMPSFYTFVMDMFQQAGAIVTSGVLKDAFNLEIMLFPWTEAGKPLPGQKPVVFLLEGRAHYFTNRPTQLMGEATFRHNMVKKLQADRFEQVLRLTVWDWKGARGREGKAALVRDLMAAHGLDVADYLPPAAVLGGGSGGADDWDVEDALSNTGSRVWDDEGDGPSRPRRGREQGPKAAPTSAPAGEAPR